VAEPALIRGGLAVDDRGSVSFVNDFHFAGVRRFYAIANHRAGFVRAWHGHRREAKYFTVLAGAALVGAVEIDDWERPSRDLRIHRHVLCAAAPAVLHVPPGFANGFMALTPDTRIVVFSTVSLEESLQDDVRFDARYWDPWTVMER
jgi:dTDP-4-dehydrorhamnose 3,5-epimerase